MSVDVIVTERGVSGGYIYLLQLLEGAGMPLVHFRQTRYSTTRIYRSVAGCCITLILVALLRIGITLIKAALLRIE